MQTSPSDTTGSAGGLWARCPFGEGPLFFPLTPFAADGSLDEAALGRHIAETLPHGVGGVFVACGTGELPALSGAEHTVAVRAARAATPGGTPLFAGAGGGYGSARAQIRAAVDAGADGILLFPPYLVGGTAQGQVRMIAEVTAGVEVPVIIYRRGLSLLDASSVGALADIPAVAGIKDGVGDVAQMGAIVEAVRTTRPDAAWEFFNGVPTAETQVADYAAVGVERYSSAVLAFLPEVALAFYRSWQAHDTAAVQRLLTEFYAPLVALRDERPGFAVALIKAGHAMVGDDLGAVRPPLVMPEPEHLARLAQIIAAGRRLVAELA